MKILIFLLGACVWGWPRFKALQQTTTTSSSSSLSSTETSSTSSTTTTSGQAMNITGLVEQLANSTQPNRYRVNVAYTLLRTNCGARIQSLLQGNVSSNKTVFIPVDEAFGSLSGLIGSGGLRLDCRGECTQNPFSIQNNTTNNDMLQNVLACLPEMMAYHVVPNNSVIFNTTNATFVGALPRRQQQQQEQILNVTVLETALNSSSALVEMDQSQVLIANSTGNATYLNYGAENPAMILSEPLNATDGTVYLINRFLLPPLPLNATLLLANQTLFLNNSLQLNQSQQNNYSNVTVFVPLDEAICPSQQQQQSFPVKKRQQLHQQQNCSVNLKAADYIVPGILYANTTSSSPGLQVQNLNNQTLQVNITEGYNVTVNGTPVAIPNVPFAGGVIHFLNGTLTSSPTSATTSATGGGLLSRVTSPLGIMTPST